MGNSQSAIQEQFNAHKCKPVDSSQKASQDDTHHDPCPRKIRKDTSGSGADPLCRNCGRALTEFLHEMEEHNAEVVCPDCGNKHGAGNPPAAAPPRKN